MRRGPAPRRGVHGRQRHRRPRSAAGAPGCDDTLEYPAARAPARARWLRDAEGGPYASPRTGQRRYCYDQDDVPSPTTTTHCPNYCRGSWAAGDGAFTSADYRARCLPAGVTACSTTRSRRADGGYAEVVNPRQHRQRQPHRREPAHPPRGLPARPPVLGPGHWVKTCAYEAQDRTNSVYTNAPCSPGARTDASCGCGPTGATAPTQGCQSTLPPRPSGACAAPSTRSPQDRRLGDRPRRDYYTAYTTRRSFITGALSTLYREQVTRVVGLTLTPPADPAAIPRVDYADDAWREYVRGPEHAGVLTTTAYLGRFPTWRSRINQFPHRPALPALRAAERGCRRRRRVQPQAQPRGPLRLPAPPLGHRAPRGLLGPLGRAHLAVPRPGELPGLRPQLRAVRQHGQFCTTRCRSFYVTQAVDADGSRYAGTLFSALCRSPEEMGRMERGPGAPCRRPSPPARCGRAPSAPPGAASSAAR